MSISIYNSAEDLSMNYICVSMRKSMRRLEDFVLHMEIKDDDYEEDNENYLPCVSTRKLIVFQEERKN